MKLTMLQTPLSVFEITEKTIVLLEKSSFTWRHYKNTQKQTNHFQTVSQVNQLVSEKKPCLTL